MLDPTHESDEVQPRSIVPGINLAHSFCFSFGTLHCIAACSIGKTLGDLPVGARTGVRKVTRGRLEYTTSPINRGTLTMRWKPPCTSSAGTRDQRGSRTNSLKSCTFGICNNKFLCGRSVPNFVPTSGSWLRDYK